MAAAPDEDVSALIERIAESGIFATEDDENAVSRTDGNDVDVTARSCELWGFETRELYKLALNFYKGKPLDGFTRSTLPTSSRCGTRPHLFRSIKSNYVLKNSL